MTNEMSILMALRDAAEYQFNRHGEEDSAELADLFRRAADEIERLNNLVSSLHRAAEECMGALSAQRSVEPTVMQPIATAPKDGTPILGYSDSDFFHGRKTRFAVVHYASEMQGWSMPGVGGLSITHWSPLPEWQTL